MGPALSQVKDILKEVLEIKMNVDGRHGLQSIGWNEEMVRDMWEKKAVKDQRIHNTREEPKRWGKI